MRLLKQFTMDVTRQLKKPLHERDILKLKSVLLMIDIN